MSQASKILKKLATSDEYKTLVEAMSKGDYQAIYESYTRLNAAIDEASKEVEAKIQGLVRQNKDEDRQKFMAALNQRASDVLPEWHRLNAEFKKQKIMEGTVFGVGSKGDPLVRSPEGRVVVISHATLKEGDKVRFKVVAEGDKIDFGRLFELSADSFDMLLNQDARDQIRNALNSVRDRVNAVITSGETDGLDDLLKELEESKKAAEKLQAEERERALGRIAALRRKLVETVVTRIAADFICREEEREIRELCTGEDTELALAAPGLCRRSSHDQFKAEFLVDENPKGYRETIQKMESSLDSMNSAIELMEFKARIEQIFPAVREYAKKLDRSLDNLSDIIRQLAGRLAQDNLACLADINAAIKAALADEATAGWLRRGFRSPDEFFTLRASLSELQTRLGDELGARREAAIRPYLRQKVTLAFSRVKVPGAR